MSHELIIDSSGEIRKCFPDNNTIIPFDIKRPTIESYEEGLEWNKLAQDKKDTAVVSSGTCKTHDKWARNNFGKDGEPIGQGIVLWGDRHTFEVVYDLQNGSELMSK